MNGILRRDALFRLHWGCWRTQRIGVFDEGGVGGRMASSRPCRRRETGLGQGHILRKPADGVDQPWPKIPSCRGRCADQAHAAGIAGGFDQVVFPDPGGVLVERVALQVDDLHVGAHLHLLVYQRLVVAGRRQQGGGAQHPIRYQPLWRMKRPDAGRRMEWMVSLAVGRALDGFLSSG